MSLYCGEKLKIEISGRSHDERIFAYAEGFPAGEPVDTRELAEFMARRNAGRFSGSTARKEPDRPVFTSGICDGITDGDRISLYIENTDVRRGDYNALKGVLRPGHADLGAFLKYGGSEDMSGGGRFSGRMTALLCAVGGIAIQILKRREIYIISHIRSIADAEDERFINNYPNRNMVDIISGNVLPAISSTAAEAMRERILSAAAEGDSVGGVIECAVLGFPAGLGGEYFERLESRLARLLFSIPAVKGVEFGAGFDGSRLHGSANNDPIAYGEKGLYTITNNAGGISGGISSGMPVLFSIAVKPTPSIGKTQRTVDITSMKEREISIRGRHDACIVPRALPVAEAAAALALLDVTEGSK